MYHLKSDHRCYQREREEQAPEGGRLFKYENANEYCSNCTDASPDGISRADRNFLNRFGKKYHAEDVEHNERNVPPRRTHAFCQVCFAQAKCKTTLKKSSQY